MALTNCYMLAHIRICKLNIVYELNNILKSLSELASPVQLLRTQKIRSTAGRAQWVLTWVSNYLLYNLLYRLRFRSLFRPSNI